jgi:UTP--glucose-1-phosphate uridylyltransferase
MSKKRVRKAVIAAAGFGTRFLPQTKALPKEMLPIVDKPIIQYVVEELVEAGIEDIVIVTGYHKRSIEDHFDHISADLRANLKQGGKLDLLEEVKKISGLANFAYVRQKGPYGNATPLHNVAHLVGDEPFIYAYADDIITAKPNRFKQMIDLYGELNGVILPCIKAEHEEDFLRYGILNGELIKNDVIKVSGLIEKPGKSQAPSNFASVGGYLLTPEVFSYIEKGRKNLHKDQEFYITTFALQPMIKDGLAFYGCLLKESKYYDTGNKLEYLKTVVDFALKNEEFGDEFKQFLHDKMS